VGLIHLDDNATAAYLQAVAADTVLIDPTQWNIIP